MGDYKYLLSQKKKNKVEVKGSVGLQIKLDHSTQELQWDVQEEVV